MLAVIDVFVREKATAVFRSEYLGGQCAHLVLDSYPTSAAVAKRLHEAGCDFEAAVPQELVVEYDKDKSRMIDCGLEDIPVLMWAVSRPNKGISGAVIAAIIDCKGKWRLMLYYLALLFPAEIPLQLLHFFCRCQTDQCLQWMSTS